MNRQDFRIYIMYRERDIAEQLSREWKKYSSKISSIERRECVMRIKHLDGQKHEIDEIKKVFKIK